jgi:hypothetical protein
LHILLAPSTDGDVCALTCQNFRRGPANTPRPSDDDRFLSREFKFKFDR